MDSMMSFAVFLLVALFCGATDAWKCKVGLCQTGTGCGLEDKDCPNNLCYTLSYKNTIPGIGAANQQWHGCGASNSAGISAATTTGKSNVGISMSFLGMICDASHTNKEATFDPSVDAAYNMFKISTTMSDYKLKCCDTAASCNVNAAGMVTASAVLSLVALVSVMFYTQ